MANVAIGKDSNGEIVVHLDGVEVADLIGAPRVEFVDTEHPIVTISVEADVLTVMMSADRMAVGTATVPGLYELEHD